MTGKRNGILAAGNWIIDIVKIIDAWPGQDSLSNILSESRSNGGSPYNILKDLSLLIADFPLQALGLIGDDDKGKSILQDCLTHNIDTSGLIPTSLLPTSYTDVMTVKENGRRTFFHNRGANAMLCEDHFDLQHSSAKIFHLGYMLLLDGLDVLASDGSTGASRIFKQAKKEGFITTADLVSENSERFKTIIPPALPFVDYLFVNEFEAEKITGISTTIDGQINMANCMTAARKILELGVNQWVILHFPKGAIAMGANHEVCMQASLQLPVEVIKGAVGAGDAFAAGVLMGIHQDWNMKKSLELGVCAAASSLFHPSCSQGILPWQDCLLLQNQYPFHML